MKKSRILILFFALILCFSCISCKEEPCEENEKGDEAPVVTEGSGSDGEIAFTYRLHEDTTTYQRGTKIVIRGTITNNSDQPIEYMGLGEVKLDMTLFCETDEKTYTIRYEPEVVPDGIPYKCEFEPGDTDVSNFSLRIPLNAPLGNYNMWIGAEGYHYVFENVLTIVE